MKVMQFLPGIIALGSYIAKNYDVDDFGRVLGMVGLQRRQGSFGRLFGSMGWAVVGAGVGAGVVLALSPELRGRISKRVNELGASLGTSPENGVGVGRSKNTPTEIKSGPRV